MHHVLACAYIPDGQARAQNLSNNGGIVSGSWGCSGATKIGEFWIFIPLCESFKRAKMKQILKVHSKEELTLAVVLNTCGHLGLRQAQNEPLQWPPLHTLYFQTLKFPKCFMLMRFGQDWHRGCGRELDHETKHCPLSDAVSPRREIVLSRKGCPCVLSLHLQLHGCREGRRGHLPSWAQPYRL